MWKPLLSSLVALAGFASSAAAEPPGAVRPTPAPVVSDARDPAVGVAWRYTGVSLLAARAVSRAPGHDLLPALSTEDPRSYADDAAWGVGSIALAAR